ncbi:MULTISPECIES: ribbon-helix-helix domain-containing protein [unclassified Streptomyces]|uniref:ribbon-helix-helix protein n=1 Tax=unclassified Streptomyces TaxID=2593676 RepID=UPI0038079C8E
MVLDLLDRPPRRGEVPDEQAETDPKTKDKVLISGRVRASVRKRMKVYAAEHDVNLQDLLDEALDEYLKKRKA